MALLDTTKLLYTALGVGVVGGSGSGAYYYLNNSDSKEVIKTKNIKEKLEEVGYLVLNGEASKWAEVLVEYNKKTNQSEIFPGSTIGSESKEGLKAKCELAIVAKDDTNYKLAKKWCVKIETIEVMLARNNYTKLAESSNSANKPKWEEKVRNIKAIPENQRNIKVTFKNNDEDVGILEKRCKELNVTDAKTFSHDDFESNYTQFRDWCATKN